MRWAALLLALAGCTSNLPDRLAVLNIAVFCIADCPVTAELKAEGRTNTP